MFLQGIKWGLIIVIPIALIFMALVYIADYKCTRKWNSFENRYEIISGCQIKKDNKFIPVSSYRLIENEQ